MSPVSRIVRAIRPNSVAGRRSREVRPRERVVRLRGDAERLGDRGSVRGMEYQTRRRGATGRSNMRCGRGARVSSMTRMAGRFDRRGAL